MSPLRTSTTRRRWLLTGAAGALSTQSPAAGAAEVESVTQAQTLAPAAVPAMLKDRLDVQGVGLVAVQVDGHRVELTAAGKGRAGSAAALDAGALFEIGSITKTFTALLLADAVVRKQIALQDAVESAWTDLRLRDSAGEPIRWIDLATHRSGLPRLPGNMVPTDLADPYADYDPARLLDFLRNFKSGTPRDTAWVYSNLGYGVLGHALGRALGSSYAELLSARVLEPLGLQQARLAQPAGRDVASTLVGTERKPPQPGTSDMRSNGASASALVDGHDANGRPVPHWHFDVMAPAGALLMTGADLGRCAQAALGAIDTPLRDAFDLALKAHAAGPTPHNPSGLAWLRAPLNGRTVMNHDGGTFGFSSSLWLDPSRRRATAVLANAMVEVKDLALHLLDPTVPPTDLRATRQTAIPLDAAQLAPLAGVYALSPRFKISVRVEDGQLITQATGQSPFQLFAKSPRQFFARITPLSVEFSAEPVPASLTLRQAGQTLLFLREP